MGVTPVPSTGRTRRAGDKRKADTLEISPSPSPAKISKATEWRKEQDKEIEKNDQLLKNNKADVKDKEMLILIRQAILTGHLGQKTFDYTSKMASFDVQKMAEYKKAQVRLLASYQSYINTLTEEILRIN